LLRILSHRREAPPVQDACTSRRVLHGDRASAMWRYIREENGPRSRSLPARGRNRSGTTRVRCGSKRVLRRWRTRAATAGPLLRGLDHAGRRRRVQGRAGSQGW
jgi:hypothetical protein